jgi:hypothetical protein
MQADSSGAAADFSHKLYETLRFDDVWNKKRLAWYVHVSQMLVNRAVIEKLWLFAHAIQLLSILWINMFMPATAAFAILPHPCLYHRFVASDYL